MWREVEQTEKTGVAMLNDTATNGARGAPARRGLLPDPVDAIPEWLLLLAG